MKKALTSWFPVLEWAGRYRAPDFASDLMAAAVTTLLLIPQSLAYALLAGMPAVTGLYASMLPVIIYALMGSSPVLGVGPSALRAIMSLAVVGGVATAASPQFLSVSMLLAMMVGAMLVVMGALRMGFIAGFLSHPVLSGFVTAAGLLIAMSQIPHVLGVKLASENLLVFVHSLWTRYDQVQALPLIVGGLSMALLWSSRLWLKPGLRALGLGATPADLVAKASPLLLMIGAIVLAATQGWEHMGLAVVGEIPQGLPHLTLAAFTGTTPDLLRALTLPALLIAMMTFVEQISIAQGMAAKRRERIDTDAEMRAMGGANLAAGLSGACSVGASFSRTAVMAEAGARTPAALILTALLLAVAALFFTPWLRHLPLAVLAATILVALGSLMDFPSFTRTWRYSRADFVAQALTFVVTLTVDLVSGLGVGVVASLALHIWYSSRPHIAIVGNLPGTEHYRNVLRHAVQTHDEILGLRVDGSLFFANARFLEDRVAAEVAARPQLRHLILQCTAVNDIDASALESLRTIHERLRDAGVLMHLSEVKGPLMDRLQRSDFLKQLSGQVFLTHHQAVTTLQAAESSARKNR